MKNTYLTVCDSPVKKKGRGKQLKKEWSELVSWKRDSSGEEAERESSIVLLLYIAEVVVVVAGSPKNAS
jgi:hypothetical protein